ncbi:MAG: nucleotidyltransferase [Gammaproteobacteria bacterium]|jgi:1L-myo-inositol 1-phosphate cytidylyltransferase|nr:nucleotidyltransferase [Gammaproteobacteria bacterium]
MNCLIVAAGTGGRLRQRGQSKPLVPVNGVRLLERVITRARSAGVERFFVVSGYRGEELRAALDVFSAREAIPIVHVSNDEWQRSNGVSVLKARPFLDGPFLLSMCDHLVDPDILRDLIASTLEPDTVTLAVDFNVAGSINDLDDVTRVMCSNGRIVHIGKVIREFNAIDTGIFLCTPVIFDALEVSQAAGDDSISGAMNVLAREDRARIFDIQGRLWLDVDDPATLDKAETLLNAGRL